MAMEYLQGEYRKAKEELKKSFEKQIVVGFEHKGKRIYSLLPYDVEILKWMMDTNKISGKIIYVGRIRFDGEEPTLEEVDLSQVKYETIRLTEKGEQLVKQQRAERRRRLRLE